MQKNETTYKPTEEALCVALKEKIITLSKKRPVWSLFLFIIIIVTFVFYPFPYFNFRDSHRISIIIAIPRTVSVWNKK